MNEHRDIYKSLFRFLSDFSDSMQGEGYSLAVLNLEAFATPAEWPKGDFIGIDTSRFEFTDAHRVSVSLTLVISTGDDRNLMRMNEITNHLVSRLIPTRRLPIYSADTGLVRGNLVVRDGTQVDSPVQTESQPARPIFVSMLSDQLTT